MKKLLLFFFFIASYGTAFAGTSTIGPPGSVANCMENAIVVESFDDQPSYIFRNDLLVADDTGLAGYMSPKTFSSFKNVIVNSIDYSSIQSIVGQNSKAVAVREVYFSENPNSIEMVLENDQIIHISPSKRQLSLGASSFCSSVMLMRGGMGGSTVSDNITVGGGTPVK